ncbi:hypothetical protein C6503_11535 [Candidatus Poribacteria bacterium]|nr:MAG: hypothetical protein C6503_11535 [Candidatus Poribacteria bacterium]
MKRYNPIQKFIVFACSCLLMFVLTSQHADAARRSRVLSIALFASGMSFQLGSTFLKASAQEHYDTYLNAAIQADIQTHKDAFLVRRNAGTIMSGVGLGCVGLAVLFSIYNQLDTPSEPSEFTEGDAALGYRSQAVRTKLHTRRIDFTNYGFGNTGLLFPRSAFQLLPHYDFQNQRASLRLLHYF